MRISHADPSLLEDALVDDAQNRKAVVAEANERTEERLACKQKKTVKMLRSSQNLSAPTPTPSGAGFYL